MTRAGLDLERVAMILIEAALHGDDAVHEKHGVSASTLYRYRVRASEDPQLAAEIARKKSLLNAEWAARINIQAPGVQPIENRGGPDESLTQFISRVAPKQANPIPWHLQQLIALLERAITSQVFAIVCMPPRYAKTTTVTRALAHAIRKYPDRLNAIGMYAEKSAFHQSRRIRKIVKEDGVKLSAGAQSVGLWLTEQEGGLFAAGANGQWTGKGISGVLVLDDILKGREQAESKVIRDKIFDTLQDDILSRLEPPNGSFVMVNTRWHEDDPAGRLLARSGANGWPKFELINLPALRDPVTGAPSDAPDALPLWPERFPLDDVQRRRAMSTPYSWNSLYQGRPVPADGAIFRASWLKKRWTTLPEGGHYVQSWDLGFAQFSKSTDFVVGQVWYIVGTDFYLVDQVRSRMSFAETLDAIRRMSRRYPRALKKLIERKANGVPVVQALSREIPGLTLLDPKDNGSKESRARAVEGLFSAGNVWLPDPHSAELPTVLDEGEVKRLGVTWLADYLAEMTAFPNAPNDDQVDATTQFLNHSAPRSAQMLVAAMDKLFGKKN